MEAMIFVIVLILFFVGTVAYANDGLPSISIGKKKAPIPTLPEYSRERRKLEEEALAAFEKELNPPKPPMTDGEYLFYALPPPDPPKTMTPARYVDLMAGSGYRVKQQPAKNAFVQGGLAQYAPPVGILPQETTKKAELWANHMLESNRKDREKLDAVNKQLEVLRKENEMMKKMIELGMRSTVSEPLYSNGSLSRYSDFRRRAGQSVPSANSMRSFSDYMRDGDHYERWTGYYKP